MVKNTKTWISWEWYITFSTRWKKSEPVFQMTHFENLAGVTFKALMKSFEAPQRSFFYWKKSTLPTAVFGKNILFI